MTNKIPAPDLDRLIQNMLLFSDEKAMALNEIALCVKDGRLTGYSCDDYVAVSDSIAFDYSVRNENPFVFSISDVDKLGEWIKKDKKVVHKYDILIRPKMTGIIFECDETSTDDESDNIFFKDLVPSENWSTVFRILDQTLPEKLILNFAIRPERLSKLWRLKADKEAPIDLRGVELKERLLIQFKKGDTLNGAIMPVERNKVKEEFLW